MLPLAEGDVSVPAKIGHLPRRTDRVEHDLQVVAPGEADDGSLRGSGRGDGRLRAEAMATQEGEKLGASHGFVPFGT